MNLSNYLNFNKLNLADWYIIGWCVYFLQGALYPVGSLFSISLLATLLVVSFYYFYIANRNYVLPLYFRGLNLLLIMFTIYGVIYIVTNDAVVHSYTADADLNTRDYLIRIYLSLLPVYSFYVFTEEKYITSRRLTRWVWGLFFVVYLNYQSRQDILRLSRGRVNNTGYMYVALLPVFAHIKNYILQYTLLLYSLYYIIVSAKRGAILIGIITLAYFIYKSVKNAPRQKKLKLTSIVCVFIVLGICAYIYRYNHSYLLQKRVAQTETGDTSNRENLYGFFWNQYLNEKEYLKLLFGNGADATILMYENFAHNDWYEILINNGLMGIALYIWYWICFAYCWLKSKSKESTWIIGLVFIIYSTRTLFSMSYNAMEFYTTCMLGYALARYDNTDEELEVIDQEDEERDDEA